MECLSYKGGCGVMRIEAFEEELALATTMYLLNDIQNIHKQYQYNRCNYEQHTCAVEII